MENISELNSKKNKKRQIEEIEEGQGVGFSYAEGLEIVVEEHGETVAEFESDEQRMLDLVPDVRGSEVVMQAPEGVVNQPSHRSSVLGLLPLLLDVLFEQVRNIEW